MDDKGITVKKSENFSEWYVQVLLKSEFIDYTDVSGALAYRPSSYAVWETISEAVDKEFKKIGVQNVYFPMFIPERYLQKEKEMLEGFTPEVAWVTHAGETKLSERLAVRPTSETIMYASYSKWIRSWRDLPMRYNQWNNVVRWEFKDPTPFIRGREFLWNEGHTVFATDKEAMAERDVILSIYRNVLKDFLALPGVVGQKTSKEKFPGAVASYSIEQLMPDMLVVQGPDFHFDGQTFSKAFDIKFLDKEGNTSYAWQNTYAISTRVVGVMVATHSDDKGLVLPPRVAQVQVMIVPIYKNENRDEVLKYASGIFDMLKDSFRVRIDTREGYSPGFKFNEWELKGVPVRIEVGAKEMEKGQVVIARRDTGAKTETDTGSIVGKLNALLDDMQRSLYKKAEEFLAANTHTVKDYEDLKKTLSVKGGIIHAPWCEDRECEDKVKEETGAKITNIPFEQGKLGAKCIYCGKKAKVMANFAKSY
ncbi:MAG: proline--tRNA ligase [Candidatus Micrarchaeota archaeon]|nr:proline--tRNA ligase [Candidatus Micrarchaeota archaeon]